MKRDGLLWFSVVVAFSTAAYCVGIASREYTRGWSDGSRAILRLADWK